MRYKFFSLVICAILMIGIFLVRFDSNVYATGPVGQYKFKAEASWMTGKINLSWYNNGSANRFFVMYGSKPGAYYYGVPNVVTTPYTWTKLTVGSLKSDRTYYFKLVSFNDDNFVSMSEPVNAITN